MKKKILVNYIFVLVFLICIPNIVFAEGTVTCTNTTPSKYTRGPKSSDFKTVITVTGGRFSSIHYRYQIYDENDNQIYNTGNEDVFSFSGTTYTLTDTRIDAYTNNARVRKVIFCVGVWASGISGQQRNMDNQIL